MLVYAMTSQPTEKLQGVADLYMASNSTLARVDEDGDLVVRSFVGPGLPIGTIVNYEHRGFLIHTMYSVGTSIARTSLIEAVNDINCKLREGCMCVDKEGLLGYKMFIPDAEGIDPRIIARCIKTSIFTFMDHLDTITEVLDSVTDLKDSDFVILDVEDSKEVKG